MKRRNYEGCVMREISINNCSSNLRVPFLFFIFVYVWFEGKMSRIQARCFGKPVRHCQFSVLAMLNKCEDGRKH
jgi:hypothetical protein